MAESHFMTSEKDKLTEAGYPQLRGRLQRKISNIHFFFQYVLLPTVILN